MSMDPNRWVNTIPFVGTKSNQEKYKLNSNKWVNTLPAKHDNTLNKLDCFFNGKYLEGFLFKLEYNLKKFFTILSSRE